MEKFIEMCAGFDIAHVVLVVLLLLGVFVMWRAGSDGTFRWSDMLRDADGKPSGARLGIFASLAVSCYAMMVMATKITSWSDEAMFWFLFTWSGTLIFVKALEKWDGKLPWSKGGSE